MLVENRACTSAIADRVQRVGQVGKERLQLERRQHALVDDRPAGQAGQVQAELVVGPLAQAVRLAVERQAGLPRAGRPRPAGQARGAPRAPRSRRSRVVRDIAPAEHGQALGGGDPRHARLRDSPAWARRQEREPGRIVPGRQEDQIHNGNGVARPASASECRPRRRNPDRRPWPRGDPGCAGRSGHWRQCRGGARRSGQRRSRRRRRRARSGCRTDRYQAAQRWAARSTRPAQYQRQGGRCHPERSCRLVRRHRQWSGSGVGTTLALSRGTTLALLCGRRGTCVLAPPAH